MSEHISDRRNFSRILFSAKAYLEQGQQRLPVQLIDLSLKGALIHKPLQWQGGNEPLHLTVELEENNPKINMTVKVCHDNDAHLGLKCVNIDIDSISHLKRLIELNTGDEALLQRELEQLIAIHS